MNRRIRRFPPGVQGYMKYVNSTWIESEKSLIIQVPTHIASHDRVKVTGISVCATSMIGPSIIQVRFADPTDITYGNYASRTYTVPASGELVKFYCKNWKCNNFWEVGQTQPTLGWIDNVCYDKGAKYKCYVTYTLYLTFGYTGRVTTCPVESNIVDIKDTICNDK